MTRFARAKGSKASNERQPAEATPWHVMKQQLEAVKGKENLEKNKTKDATELRKKDDPYYWDTLVRSSEWADFDTDKSPRNVKKNDSGKPEKKSPEKGALKKVGIENSVPNDPEVDKSRKRKSEKLEKSAGEAENIPKKKKKKKNKSANGEDAGAESSPKKKKQKSADVENGVDNSPKKNRNKSVDVENFPKNKNNESADKGDDAENSPKKKKKKKKENKPVDSEENSTVPKNVEEKNVNYVKLSKRQIRNRKNKMKKNNPNKEEVSTPITFNVEGNDWKTDIKFGAGKNNPKSKPKPENNNNPNNNRDQRFNQKVVKQKPGKVRDDLEHKRRKPDPGEQKVIINGKEVEIVKFDRFPVTKDDAERLAELRKKMVMNGIPGPEINRAMKLERRRAEKTLARMLKTICFHCRKGGHNLSDCPELGREEAATGICFKCGSTEHAHLECKVVKKEEFRFAKCFICREQGHIAKQCPDHPLGLYPSGGGCHYCGDVTHLKKDCPEVVSQKETSKITLSTIGDVDSVETIDGLDKEKKSEAVGTTKKIVKF